MPSLSEQGQAAQLLQEIRMRIAELRRLEQSRASRSELDRQRREITRLQWQLGRFVTHHPGSDDLAA